MNPFFLYITKKSNRECCTRTQFFLIIQANSQFFFRGQNSVFMVNLLQLWFTVNVKDSKTITLWDDI